MKRTVKYLLLFLFIIVSERAYACTVSATGVRFANYDVFSPTALKSTGSVTVSCNTGPPPNATISIGASPNSGGFIPRKMKHATLPDTLNYNLYIDPAGVSVWGDGTGGTNVVTVARVKRNAPRTVTIYGVVPPAQNVSTGLYSDILTVTVTP